MTPALATPGARTPALKKILAIVSVSIRQGLEERASVIGRMLFYTAILLIFSRLWEVIHASGEGLVAEPRDFVWYLAITEWILLSQPTIHLDVEAEVRRGEVAYALTRPISYARLKLAEGAGSLLVRMCTLGPFGAALAWWLAGGGPSDPRALWLGGAMALAAGWVALCFHFAIGVCAFWIQDCSPVYWIWQKAFFLLGGLMLPLEIYPEWLRALAVLTPFSALLYEPARTAFGWHPEVAALGVTKIVVWGVVAGLVAVALERRAVRTIEIGGG